jgi:hypothetical protein
MTSLVCEVCKVNQTNEERKIIMAKAHTVTNEEFLFGSDELDQAPSTSGAAPKGLQAPGGIFEVIGAGAESFTKNANGEDKMYVVESLEVTEGLYVEGSENPASADGLFVPYFHRNPFDPGCAPDFYPIRKARATIDQRLALHEMSRRDVTRSAYEAGDLFRGKKFYVMWIPDADFAEPVFLRNRKQAESLAATCVLRGSLPVDEKTARKRALLAEANATYAEGEAAGEEATPNAGAW